MKLKYLFYFSIVMLFFSCRKEDESDLQKIDQVINIYVTNTAGNDLLNIENADSYTSFRTQDLNADKALQEFAGVAIKKDLNNIYYLEYVSGAVKILKNADSETQRTYQSDFYLNLLKTIDNTTVIDTDTLKIEYNWVPNLFQVSKVWYNNKLVFSKIEGKPNIIKIVK